MKTLIAFLSISQPFMNMRRFAHMHYRIVLVALSLSLWITVTLPQPAQGGFATDAEPKYAQEVHRALNDLDIPLNEQETTALADRVVELCRAQQYVYTAKDTNDFIASLQSSMSQNLGGLPTPGTPVKEELRKLRIRESLLRLQTGMEYFGTSQSANANSSQQPSVSDDFWKRVETLASEHFTSVPEAIRQQKHAKLRASWQAIENNRFTPAGKKALRSEATEQILNQLVVRRLPVSNSRNGVQQASLGGTYCIAATSTKLVRGKPAPTPSWWAVMMEQCSVDGKEDWFGVRDTR